MSVRDAAVQVLRDAGSPLHANEITERILARKLWDTPSRLLTVVDLAEIKQRLLNITAAAN